MLNAPDVAQGGLVQRLRAATADLLLGSGCAGCARPGLGLCPECERALRGRPTTAWPDPTPTALVDPEPLVPVAAGDYDGPLRSCLLQFKENHRIGLLDPLARTLVAAVEGAAPDDRLVLVPMPSRGSVVRDRGYDAVRLLAVRAARRLRRRGRDVRVACALRHRSTVRDQAGLSSRQRLQNLTGALSARPTPGGRSVVLVDDVITTGASMAEAARVLRGCGTPASRIAVIAATRRRASPPTSRPAEGWRRRCW